MPSPVVPTSTVTTIPPPMPPQIPPVSAAAAGAGLLDVRTIDPDAIVDLRYATTDNFTHVALYPPDARCLIHQSMAAGVKTASDELRGQGYQLVYFDCYRPHAVQVEMFRIVPDPAWVAKPGPYATSHEAGRSIDVTLASANPDCPAAAQVNQVNQVNQVDQVECLLDMGTDFDDFTTRAHAYATTGLTAAEQSNRAVLRAAMAKGGLSVYSGEWWHFDGPGSAVHRPQLDVPIPG